MTLIGIDRRAHAVPDLADLDLSAFTNLTGLFCILRKGQERHPFFGVPIALQKKIQRMA